MQFDAREKPPEDLRLSFKAYQGASEAELSSHGRIVDFADATAHHHHLFEQIEWRRAATPDLTAEAHALACENLKGAVNTASRATTAITAFRCKSIQGLVVIPSLMTLDVQRAVLATLFHRDLVDSNHKTNVHFHHFVSYPPANKSFFDCEPSDESFFRPRDPSMHKNLSVAHFLNKKLRWMTLGGQYDWTAKEYPREQQPDFPSDLAVLLTNYFPETNPEAAIVNVYSAGDTLSLHRDVSEASDKGLVSLSFGCDGLFMIGLDRGDDEPVTHVLIRIRSGDAVYMQGASRFAWHGVPRIVAGTCPAELQPWPARGTSGHEPASNQRPHQQWDRWLAGKRINLNVRQMKA